MQVILTLLFVIPWIACEKNISAGSIHGNPAHVTYVEGTAPPELVAGPASRRSKTSPSSTVSPIANGAEYQTTPKIFSASISTDDERTNGYQLSRGAVKYSPTEASSTSSSTETATTFHPITVTATLPKIHPVHIEVYETTPNSRLLYSSSTPVASPANHQHQQSPNSSNGIPQTSVSNSYSKITRQPETQRSPAYSISFGVPVRAKPISVLNRQASTTAQPKTATSADARSAAIIDEGSVVESQAVELVSSTVVPHVEYAPVVVDVPVSPIESHHSIVQKTIHEAHPAVKTRKIEVRRPAIRKQFYDVEERIIIRPAGSVLLELDHPVASSQTGGSITPYSAVFNGTHSETDFSKNSELIGYQNYHTQETNPSVKLSQNHPNIDTGFTGQNHQKMPGHLEPNQGHNNQPPSTYPSTTEHSQNHPGHDSPHNYHNQGHPNPSNAVHFRAENRRHQNYQIPQPYEGYQRPSGIHESNQPYQRRTIQTSPGVSKPIPIPDDQAPYERRFIQTSPGVSKPIPVENFEAHYDSRKPYRPPYNHQHVNYQRYQKTGDSSIRHHEPNQTHSSISGHQSARYQEDIIYLQAPTQLGPGYEGSHVIYTPTPTYQSPTYRTSTEPYQPTTLPSKPSSHDYNNEGDIYSHIPSSPGSSSTSTFHTTPNYQNQDHLRVRGNTHHRMIDGAGKPTNQPALETTTQEYWPSFGTGVPYGDYGEYHPESNYHDGKNSYSNSPKEANINTIPYPEQNYHGGSGYNPTYQPPVGTQPPVYYKYHPQEPTYFPKVDYLKEDPGLPQDHSQHSAATSKPTPSFRPTTQRSNSPKDDEDTVVVEAKHINDEDAASVRTVHQQPSQSRHFSNSDHKGPTEDQRQYLFQAEERSKQEAPTPMYSRQQHSGNQRYENRVRQNIQSSTPKVQYQEYFQARQYPAHTNNVMSSTQASTSFEVERNPSNHAQNYQEQYQRRHNHLNENHQNGLVSTTTSIPLQSQNYHEEQLFRENHSFARSSLDSHQNAHVVSDSPLKTPQPPVEFKTNPRTVASDQIGLGARIPAEHSANLPFPQNFTRTSQIFGNSKPSSSSKKQLPAPARPTSHDISFRNNSPTPRLVAIGQPDFRYPPYVEARSRGTPPGTHSNYEVTEPQESDFESRNSAPSGRNAPTITGNEAAFPAVTPSPQLTPEQSNANQKHFIDLLFAHGKVSEIGFGPTDSPLAVELPGNGYIRGRVIAATPAPPNAPTSETIHTRRIIVSHPFETIQEVEIKEPISKIEEVHFNEPTVLHRVPVGAHSGHHS
ncbi:uncharacterized protein LOC119647471 isoform X2 [Hermetia illucens]|uniref:uncharacterized protein LOC119647471 isoform X2 n=1 Tax=Hermetia illucens TaxID=343691 RepID=UPI0018CC2800|nr:uncharacterized protein LOC119647471 isoform X2 [Hermetia illucens]